jgi:hypothetical protein
MVIFVDHRRPIGAHLDAEEILMNRFKLVCRNADLEEIFTIEGYETEREAQDMLDTLNRTDVHTENTWRIEPLRYN